MMMVRRWAALCAPTSLTTFFLSSLTQMMWSLPSGNSLPKLFKTGQGEIWHLKARRSGALQQRGEQTQTRIILKKWVRSSAFHLGITGTMKKIKTKTWVGLREAVEWAAHIWFPWSGLCLPPVVNGKSSNPSINEHVSSLMTPVAGWRPTSCHSLCICTMFECHICWPGMSANPLNADALSWAGLHVFNFPVTSNKNFYKVTWELIPYLFPLKMWQMFIMIVKCRTCVLLLCKTSAKLH